MPRNPERPDEWILDDEVMACCQRDRQRLGPEEDAELTEQNRLRTEQVKKSHLQQQCFDASKTKEFLSACEQHNERMVKNRPEDFF